MKKLFVLTGVVLSAALVLASCGKEKISDVNSEKGVNPFDQELKADYYYGTAHLSVPAGTTTVYVEYTGKDGSTKTEAVTVEPEIAKPANGKDVEPFGSVDLVFKSPNATNVSVYYIIPEIPGIEPAATKAGEDEVTQIYSLSNFPVEKIAFGEFGKTRYVQMPWDFAWLNDETTGNVNKPTYPADVVFYDEEHDHTLRYKFAYAGSVVGCEAYFLEDAYTIEDHVVTGFKYHCTSCGDGCPYCMPWGCSCGCGYVNSAFKGSGDTTSEASSSDLVPGAGQGTGLVYIDHNGTIIVDYAPKKAGQVQLNEPAAYVSTDDDQTFYHSSGVVMFEDSWPVLTKGKVYDTDFDDVVVDYDFEAKIMPDSRLESDGWREQLKVVLHLRAVGSNNQTGPGRVGVRLENFDQQYIESVEQYFTLDSWQNPHGNLPAFTETTLQRNSGHYELDQENPVVEMAHVFAMNQERAGKGENAEYTYVNNSFTNHTVFNLTYGFKDRDKTQYDPALESIPSPADPSKKYWNIVKDQKFYNCIPGYINVSGGLFTYTVIYNMKPRANMAPEERELAKQNMIQAVTNTLAQNFYIITMDWRTVGLKGYDPVFINDSVHKNQVSKYNSTLAEGVEAGYITEDNPYAGTNGMVWGLKCPTLTKHVWNRLYFSDAYPHYEEWMASEGTTNSDWYYKDVNPFYLTCWW